MRFQWGVLAFALVAGLSASLYINKTSPPQDPIPVNLFAQNDQQIDLYNPSDNRFRVLYFGFTHCPDVCPTSLAILSASLKQLPASIAEQLWPVFISLDPERDTPEKSQRYAEHFHPSMTGLSGTYEQTKAIANKYGVLYIKTELEGSQSEYTIDHNSYFYVLNPDGSLRGKVAHTLNPQYLSQEIENIVNKPKTE